MSDVRFMMFICHQTRSADGITQESVLFVSPNIIKYSCLMVASCHSNVRDALYLLTIDLRVGTVESR